MLNIKYDCPLLGNSFATFPVVKQFAMDNNVTVNFVNNPFTLLLPKEDWWVSDKNIQGKNIRIGIDDPVTGIVHNAMAQLEVTEFNPRNIHYPIAEPVLNRPYIVLAPKASGAIKELKKDVWQDVIDYLNKRGIIPVVLGSNTYTRCIQPNTANIKTLQSWIPHAVACVGLSSGLFWMAYQYDVPTIKINGFCDEMQEFMPTFQIRKDGGCRNCWNAGEVTNFDVCPRHRDFECMDFTAQDIIERIERLFIRSAIKGQYPEWEMEMEPYFSNYYAMGIHHIDERHFNIMEMAKHIQYSRTSDAFNHEWI